MVTVAGIKISSIHVRSPGDERPSICTSLDMIRSSIKILEPSELNLLPLTPKKLAVKSKYAFFFSSVADPGVLALLPCPPPPFLLLMKTPDHRLVHFFFTSFKALKQKLHNRITAYNMHLIVSKRRLAKHHNS